MSITDKLLKENSKLKHRIILRTYPDINDIFNSDTTFPLDEAILNYNYAKYLLINYNINCKVIEDIYIEFINNIAVFINELKYNPSVEEIMYIFCYLVYNGYLSENNNFIFDFPEKELDLRMAISVINGQGVCRNVGTFLSDIFKAFNLESYGIITDRSTYSSPQFLITQDMFNLCNSEIFKAEKSMDEHYKNNPVRNGDHFEVLVKDEKWKLLDPSHSGSYRIVRKDTGYSIMKYLKFYSLYATGECSIGKTMKLYRLMKDKYLVPNNTQQNIESQKECYSICEHNKQKILNFRKYNQRHIELLSESIKGL